MNDDESRVALLQESWLQVLGWCQEHAPLTAAALRQPADDSVLAAAQEALGRVWPMQLVAWFGLGDGAGRALEATVLPPAYEPLGVEDVVDEWRRKTVAANGSASRAATGPAGSLAVEFLEAWVPIAFDGSGDVLFVDLRPGSRRGCVGEFLHGEGFRRPPLWADMAAMVGEVAEALHNGGLLAGGRVAAVEGDRLVWDDAPRTGTGPAGGAPGEVPWGDLDAMRAAIVMGALTGQSDREIARQLGVSPQLVAELRQVFLD